MYPMIQIDWDRWREEKHHSGGNSSQQATTNCPLVCPKLADWALFVGTWIKQHRTEIGIYRQTLDVWCPVNCEGSYQGETKCISTTSLLLLVDNYLPNLIHILHRWRFGEIWRKWSYIDNWFLMPSQPWRSYQGEPDNLSPDYLYQTICLRTTCT